jgi:hypothetical protein
MLAFLLAVASLPGPQREPVRSQEVWERAFVVQVEEFAPLSAALWNYTLLSDEGCYIGPKSPSPPKPSGALIDEVVAPALKRLVTKDASLEVREASERALHAVLAPPPAATAEKEVSRRGWSASSLDLAQLERELEQHEATGEAIGFLHHVAQLSAGHPLRQSLGERLLAASPDEHIHARLFAIGAVATSSPRELDRALQGVLCEHLDADAPQAQIARLALARCAARTEPHSSAADPSRERQLEVAKLLRERLGDSNAPRRRATWIAAAWLERSRALAHGARDAGLRAELKARFSAASAPRDVDAGALALAVLGDFSSAESIRERFAARPTTRLALAVALLDDREMIEAAQKWEQAQISPSARVDAALAQVLLGDKSVVRDWIERCDDAKPASILELVRGLDAFGDTSAVQPLLKFSENTELTDEVRIAAIHALSAVCSPDPLQRTLARAYTGG